MFILSYLVQSTDCVIMTISQILAKFQILELKSILKSSEIFYNLSSLAVVDSQEKKNIISVKTCEKNLSSFAIIDSDKNKYKSTVKNDFLAV